MLEQTRRPTRVQKEVHLEAYQCSEQAVQLYKDGWLKEPVKEELSGMSHFRNPHDDTIDKPVMISGLDTDEVDNDFFLVPVAVRDHKAKLMTSFPVENRLTGQVCAAQAPRVNTDMCFRTQSMHEHHLLACSSRFHLLSSPVCHAERNLVTRSTVWADMQASNDLNEHLSKHINKAYNERLADFHLLLWLASTLHWADTDVAVVVEAVNEGKPLLEGYKMMIDSMAGL